MFKGSVLKEKRIAKGYTLKELAEEAGVPFTTINGWEINQNAKPRKSLLLKVCDVLKINIAILYEDEEITSKSDVDIIALIKKIITIYERDADDPRLAEAKKIFDK